MKVLKHRVSLLFINFFSYFFMIIVMAMGIMPDSIMGERFMAANQETGTPTSLPHPYGQVAAVHAEFEGISLFLCGDVMTGRGIDQIMPHPGSHVIHESYMRNANGYVQLAEKVNGLIPKPVSYDYIWGDALPVLKSVNPDLRVINLETSVTTNDDFWPKGINYRMHPRNAACLSAAGIDCCILANNHVLDWGHTGLIETLDVIKAEGIKPVGAGKDRYEAEAPAIFKITGKGRLVILAYGSKTSGIPVSWAASINSPGINMLPDLSARTIDRIKKEVAAIKQPGDVVLLSLHWGGNWGYKIDTGDRQFAHRLIDEAGVDAIFGHSSHHVKGIEVYRQKLILYGCGDFLNDYEGIQGHEQYRSHLTLMFFPNFDPLSGKLLQMRMIPMQIKRFQTVYATKSDSQWLMDVLNREGRGLGTGVKLQKDGSFRLIWD
jgi:poly-gamma-glutamate synthesis protein (capsule biosynthesis protein)